MPGAHDVVLGLEERAERRQALVLADRREAVAPPGQHLVRVGLVADVPEDLVAGGVEQAVQGDGQLAGSEVGAEVATDLSDHVDHVGADLLRELLKLIVVEAFQILGAVDLPEELAARCLVARCSGLRSCVPGVDEVGDQLQVVAAGTGFGERLRVPWRAIRWPAPVPARGRRG